MKAAKNRVWTRNLTTLFYAGLLWCIPSLMQAQNGSIGNFVWQDLNKNGLQDSGEPGLAAVQVQLYDCLDLDNPVQTVTTNANGLYTFNNVPEGNYRVRFGTSPGFNPTFEDSGNDDAIDSDGGVDGWTVCFSLAAGENVTNIDAGFQVCDPNAPLICNNMVNISLDPSGSAIVTPNTLLEGDNICSNLFEVDIEWMGQSIEDTLTCDQVGFMVIATVTDQTNWNTCTVMIEVNDALEPTILQPDTKFVNCNGSTDPDDIGGVVAFDNCSVVTLTYSDSIVDGTCQDNFVEHIFRTWVASDDNGHSESAVQEIFVTRPDIEEVVFPDNTTLFGCGNEDTEPSSTGQPSIYGIPVQSSGLCGFQAFKTDQVNNGACQGEYTILREWTLIEDCTGQVVKQSQLITVIDNEAPQIDCPSPLNVGTNSSSCSANILFPGVAVFDNCSDVSNITVQIETPFGNVSGNGGVLTGVPPGTFTATYNAADDCGNTTSCDVTVNVMDNTPPVAVCDQNTIITLESTGSATICWPTIEDGSYDNCQVLAIKIKRADASLGVPFTDCVSFGCGDIGGDVTVRMRVYDQIGNFSEADPLGRFNECVSTVTVVDAIKPVLACPVDVTLDCQEDLLTIPELVSDPNGGAPTYQGGQLVGYYPAVFDNCDVERVDVVQTGTLDNCGEGTLFRIFTATDVNDNTSSCSQKLTIQPTSLFQINDTDCTNSDPFDGVEWPCDYMTSTCGQNGLTPLTTGEPTIINDGCALVGVDYNDLYFPIQEPGCIKIIRQWLIVDWCQPDPSDPLNYKSWTFNQEIKVINSEDPEFVAGCADVTIGSNEPGCDGAHIELSVEATDDCTDASDLNFIYKIDLFNDGIGPLQGFDYNNQSHPGAAPTNQANEAGGFFPFGTHRIVWTVEDGCGNFDACQYLFTVQDGMKPTPLGFDELTVDINPSTGQVTVFAEDFNAGSIDNCTSPDDLRFSYSTNPNDASRIFTCDDLGLMNMQLYVTDEAGNQDFVDVTLIVQDNNNICPGTSPIVQITGLITTADDDPVQNVNVNLMQNNTMLLSQMTTNAGTFGFNATQGGNYSLEPHKDEDYLNGVSTFDLVLMAQHILKTYKLDTPYKIIAADVNNDGKVTTFDILELRKLILQIDSELASNESWRFVDKNYAFPNPEDPFFPPFPELIDINNLTVDEIYNDFVGIKIGDVSGDVKANQLTSPVTEVRSELPFVIRTEDQMLEAGESFTVALNAHDVAELHGFQFTLRFDPDVLRFEDVSFQSLNKDNFGFSLLEDGLILVSYQGMSASIREGDLLASLNFTANREAQLSQSMDLNSSQLVAEAYRQGSNGQWSRHLTTLRFDSEGLESPADQGTVLYQNRPNPFREFTQIQFYVAEATDAQLIIRDGAGRILKSIKGHYPAGYHNIEMSKEEIGAAGVVFYTLETPNYQQTMKMVLID